MEVLRIADGQVEGRLTPPDKRSLRAMWATVKGEGGGEGELEGGVRLLMVDEAETLALKDGKDKTSKCVWGSRDGRREGRRE